MYRKPFFCLAIFGIFISAGCLPIETIAADSPNIIESVAAPLIQTVIAVPENQSSTVQPTLLIAPLPTETQIPEVYPEANLSNEKCLKAVPGVPLDVTIPDGTNVKPGEVFSKTWRLINLGSCSWTPEYAVIWFSGVRFGAPLSQAFRQEVRPGESVEITLDLVAPVQSGVHQGNWKLMAPDGQMFGIGPGSNAPFWVRVEVVEVMTETSAPLPSSTPTPIVYTQGTLNLNLGSKVNLDNGDLNLAGNNDLELINNEQGNLSLSIINSARLAYFGTREPSLSECLRFNPVDTFVAVSQEEEGNYLCYRTNQGLPGFIRFQYIDSVEGAVEINFLTWFIP